MKREVFSSRIGFILSAASCAIGLGNVWRFPYITGMYGGAVFVFIYLAIIFFLCIPLVAIELSIGRGSRQSYARAFAALEPAKKKWHPTNKFLMLSNYIVIFFYTVICSWIVYFIIEILKGDLALSSPLSSAASDEFYQSMLSQPLSMTFFTFLVVIFAFLICSLGIKNGLERFSKYMILGLFVIFFCMIIYCFTLPNASEGFAFYLKPNLQSISEHGLPTIINAAMTQAFFSVGIGAGSFIVFGSYLSSERTTFSSAFYIAILDTAAAFMAGLIIFPACFSFGIQPDSGPSLLFITMPTVFSHLPQGTFWCVLFFIALFLAVFTSVISIIECNITCCIDLFKWTRRKSIWCNAIITLLCTLPCILGFNVLKELQPLGAGTSILDLEDFISSKIFIPLSALLYLLFATSRYGWGFKNMLREINTGAGSRFPAWMRPYCSLFLPIVILIIFISGFLFL